MSNANIFQIICKFTMNCKVLAPRGSAAKSAAAVKVQQSRESLPPLQVIRRTAPVWPLSVALEMSAHGPEHWEEKNKVIINERDRQDGERTQQTASDKAGGRRRKTYRYCKNVLVRSTPPGICVALHDTSINIKHNRKNLTSCNNLHCHTGYLMALLWNPI